MPPPAPGPSWGQCLAFQGKIHERLDGVSASLSRLEAGQARLEGIRVGNKEGEERAKETAVNIPPAKNTWWEEVKKTTISNLLTILIAASAGGILSLLISHGLLGKVVEKLLGGG